MAEPEIYEQAIIYLRGQIFVDATTIEIAYEDADKPVFLLNGAFFVAPGERLMRVSILNAVAQGTFLHSLGEKYLKVEPVPFAIQLATNGKRLTSAGFVSAPAYSFGVNENAACRIGITAKPAFFK